MPWVRFDDQYPIHRKVDGLTDAAYRLHTSAIFWSARNLTDGFVPKEDLDGVTARVRTPSRFAAECVRRGVWHDARQPCPSEKCPGPVDSDGWVIHDYLEYQFSKEQVLREREASAKRQKKWRGRNAVTNGVTSPVDNHEIRSGQSAAGNQGRSSMLPDDNSNAVSNAVSNGCSKPAPTRSYTHTALNQGEPFLRARDLNPDFPEVKSSGPASRLPSARPLNEALRDAGVPPGHRPASPETRAAAAEQARRALGKPP